MRLTLTMMFGLTVLASSASAQVVHEFFRYGPGLGASSDGLPELPEPGLDGEAAAASGGVTLDADGPNLPDWFSGPTAGGQRNGPASGRTPVGLDRDTDREGQLHYAAVWTPAVAPFKRSNVRDAVADSGSSPVLVVSDQTVRTVTIDSNEPASDHEAFVGSFDLRLRPGQLVPIPSVAPGMRVHRLDLVPPVPAELLTDAADNWFVRADASGSARMTLYVSAPRFYFAGPLPSMSVRTGPSRAPVAVQQDARRVLDAIGVTDDMTEVEVLRRLATWFRRFDARPFPETERSDNLYLDIALSQIGVCRHRSIAFVMTAQAAGLRARYVYNEAHAFTEVFLTGAGWLRVDLGGAADGLDVFSDEPRDIHDPGPDPLGGSTDAAWTDTLPAQTRAWPSDGGSDASSTSGAGDDDTSASDGRSPSSEGHSTADANAGNDGGASDSTDARNDHDGDPSDTPRAEVPARLADLPPGPGAPAVFYRPPDGEPQVFRMTTRVELLHVPERMWRGEPTRVFGRLIGGDDAGAGGRAVQLWLGPADPSRQDAPVRALTTVVCADDGSFEATIDVPTTLAPGRWGLYAVFEGDAVYEPSRSN